MTAAFVEFGPSSRDGAKARTGEDMHAHRSTVLLIDVDPSSRAPTASLLHREGFLVKVAASRSDALRFAREHHPAVILLEVAAPGSDSSFAPLPGAESWETLEELKIDPRTRDIPVVVFRRFERAGDPPSDAVHSTNARLLELVRRHVRTNVREPNP